MTFEQYLANVNALAMPVLIIDRKDWRPKTGDEVQTIFFGTRNVYLPDGMDAETERFYWGFCPNNPDNHTAVKKLFRSAYRKDLDKYEHLPR